jgi:branched-subunit amino acid transport protein
MTIGVGLYAPCLVLVAMLGMNPETGFPIMMGSCAFLMPLASSVFVKRQRYAPGAALGLTLGGIPAVMLAVFVFEKLFTAKEREEVEENLWRIKWLVAVVIAWTAINLLLTAARERRQKMSLPTP